MEQNKAQIVDLKSPVAKRAANVANRLLQANKNVPGVENIDWTLTVIDSKTINAVAFPVIDELLKRLTLIQFFIFLFVLEWVHYCLYGPHQPL